MIVQRKTEGSKLVVQLLKSSVTSLNVSTLSGDCAVYECDLVIYLCIFVRGAT